MSAFGVVTLAGGEYHHMAAGHLAEQECEVVIKCLLRRDSVHFEDVDNFQHERLERDAVGGVGVLGDNFISSFGKGCD